MSRRALGRAMAEVDVPPTRQRSNSGPRIDDRCLQVRLSTALSCCRQAMHLPPPHRQGYGTPPPIGTVAAASFVRAVVVVRHSLDRVHGCSRAWHLDRLALLHHAQWRWTRLGIITIIIIGIFVIIGISIGIGISITLMSSIVILCIIVNARGSCRGLRGLRGG